MWGLGNGDWGLGIWGLGPIPNPQSPFKQLFHVILFIKFIKNYLIY